MHFFVFNTSFLLNLYVNKYGIPEKLGMSERGLERVTERLVSILRGCDPDLKIAVEVRGEVSSFFNAKEISHMTDVFMLTRGMKVVGVVLLAVSVLMLFVVFFVHPSKHGAGEEGFNAFFLGNLVSTTVIFIFIIVTVIASFVDIRGIIAVAHNMVFKNSNWVFDPTYSNLIYLCPLNLYVASATRLFTIWGALKILEMITLIVLKYVKINRKRDLAN